MVIAVPQAVLSDISRVTRLIVVSLTSSDPSLTVLALLGCCFDNSNSSLNLANLICASALAPSPIGWLVTARGDVALRPENAELLKH